MIDPQNLIRADSTLPSASRLLRRAAGFFAPPVSRPVDAWDRTANLIVHLPGSAKLALLFGSHLMLYRRVRALVAAL
jgi:hypothetical protein